MNASRTSCERRRVRFSRRSPLRPPPATTTRPVLGRTRPCSTNVQTRVTVCAGMTKSDASALRHWAGHGMEHDHVVATKTNPDYATLLAFRNALRGFLAWSDD